MKISVVTISFNQAQFLAQCIDSVLSQDGVSFEYIVVDPGSTDGSRDIIDSYGDRIIRIYEADSGPADGLNKGFARATGDIFCYLNSDDVFMNNAFTNVNKFMDKHCDVDICYGHCFIIDSDGNKLRKCYSDNFNFNAAAYGAVTIIQPSTFFKRTIFEQVGGFNANNKSNWDGELFIDLMLHGANAKKLDCFLSYYRVHPLGITGSGRLEAAHSHHSRNMFVKIKNRELKFYDKYLSLLYRLRKHIINPHALIERLIFGPVFGRS